MLNLNSHVLKLFVIHVTFCLDLFKFFKYCLRYLGIELDCWLCGCRVLNYEHFLASRPLLATSLGWLSWVNICRRLLMLLIRHWVVIYWALYCLGGTCWTDMWLPRCQVLRCRCSFASIGLTGHYQIIQLVCSLCHLRSLLCVATLKKLFLPDMHVLFCIKFFTKRLKFHFISLAHIMCLLDAFLSNSVYLTAQNFA